MQSLLLRGLFAQRKAIITLGLYMFVLLLTELLINNRSIGALGANNVVWLYALYSAAIAGGYFSFAYVENTWRTNRLLRLLHLCAAIYLLALSGLYLTSGMTYLLSAVFGMFAIGVMGAAVLYWLSYILQESAYTGRVIGVAIFGEIIIQYLVQRFVNSSLLWATLVIALGLFAYCFWCELECILDCAKPYDDSCKRDYTRKGAGMIAVVAFLSIIMGINDGIIVEYHAKGLLNLEGWPRLCYAIGILLAGFVADIHKRKYLSISTLAGMFIMTIAFAFLRDPSLYNINLATLYFAGSFYIMYLTVSFVDLSAHTGHRAAWAGAGRCTRSVILALTTVPAAKFFSSFDISELLIADIFLLCLAFLTMFFNDLLVPHIAVNTHNTVSKAYRIQTFIVNYNITEREAEVLERILNTDDGIKEMAKELIISERVLQRHLTNIYRKTNTKSRIGLCLLFYGDSYSRELGASE